MGKQLFIVESPAKAKTIQSYLGQGWDVTASVGHIRDLPVKEMGVDAPEHRPHYEILNDKQKTVGWIRKLAAAADAIWLATDDDREGEAIAWHLQQVIGEHTYHRVRFNAITKSEIQKAIRSPGVIDTPKFLAQQARRVIDRYAGYLVSNALQEKTQNIRSAGRVQTPALRMIVEREIEIEQFQPTTHYGIRAVSNPDEPWTADWDVEPHLAPETDLMTDPSLPGAITERVTSATVSNVVKSQAKRNPPPPMTTSTLQQAASNKLNYDSKSAMQAAQKLYERGLITYHRTDNPNLSEEATEALRAYLTGVGLADGINPSIRTWKAKDGSQEAHEAIRPTDFNTTEANTGNANQDAVYSLIWSAAVGCQMKAVVYDTVKVTLSAVQSVPAAKAPIEFIAKGRTLVYDGWLRILNGDPTQEHGDGGTEDEESDDQPLPVLQEGQTITFSSVVLLTKTTKPPPRYTPARLVKELERRGVGRPSTYADIQTGLIKREYVKVTQKKFIPTPIGRTLIELVCDAFCFADIEFTNQLEDRLDALAMGQADYQTLVNEFYSTLKLELQAFYAVDVVPEIAATVEGLNEPAHPCPECEGQLSKRSGANGAFWGCGNYPDCTYTTQDNRGKPQTHYVCPSCQNGRLRRIKGNKGFFWGCSEFKAGCKATFEDKRGKPQLPKEGAA